ncbi:MAG: hypothetical protein ACMUIP_11470 [bacterium]
MSLVILSKASALEIEATCSAGYDSNPALDPNGEEGLSLAIYALEIYHLFFLPFSLETEFLLSGLYRDYSEIEDNFQGGASLETRCSFFQQRLVPSVMFAFDLYRDKIIEEDEKNSYTVDVGARYILNSQLMFGLSSVWRWDRYVNDIDATDDIEANSLFRRARGGYGGNGYGGGGGGTGGQTSSNTAGSSFYSSDSGVENYLHTLSFSLNVQPKRYFYSDFIYRRSRLSSNEYTSEEFIISPTLIAPKDIIISMWASLIEYSYQSIQELDYARPEQEIYVSIHVKRRFKWITPFILLSWEEGDLISPFTEKYYQKKVIECGISVSF